MNQAWSMITWLIQCAFDWAYLKTTQWKVPKRRQKPHKPTKRRNNINRLHARGQRLIIVNESRTKRTKPTSRTALFDTDSKAIGIDNRCSACISHDINDFVGPVHKSDKVISAFGGQRQMKVYSGTIVWRWADDNGVQSKFRIPNSYYVPEGKSTPPLGVAKVRKKFFSYATPAFQYTTTRHPISAVFFQSICPQTY